MAAATTAIAALSAPIAHAIKPPKGMYASTFVRTSAPEKWFGKAAVRKEKSGTEGGRHPLRG